MVALNNILFLDIETVPQYDNYIALPHEWKELWDHKASYLIRNKETETAETLYGRAGIYAEFGKIICISCGVIQESGKEKKLVLKSFYEENEKKLLLSFSEMLNKWSAGENRFLCAHNGKEFDYPYLCRRLIVHNIPIPSILQISGKKPWEVNHLDTLELWKFGDFKSYTSLNLLAHVLGIPTPKDDIDGSKVGEVYWTARTASEKENSMRRIVEYCQKDVITLAQIFLRMNGERGFPEENIEIKHT